MEQLRTIDGGTCGTSDLTDVLGGVLGRSMVWTPISSPPDMTSQEYGWPMSEPVLGVTKRGRMQVVTYEQVDEDCEATWKTACSERWDVTGELTHWMNLPQPPNVGVNRRA